MKGKKMGKCPECGNTVNLRKDGFLVRHVRLVLVVSNLAGMQRARCPGSGIKPEEVVWK